MQVSSNSVLDATCAVVTEHAPINFKISNDPAFFQLLSTSLYSNPRLAVIREILFNAWDAHKEAGIDVPVQVTLTDTELIIKDFGNGIPHDRIGEIYGVYGASTKVIDTNQTGGFGLGCKAPFSYTNNFSVISCHNKVKTIYELLRNDYEAEGRPTIRTLLQEPTNETGLTVSIPLKDTYTPFRKYIQEFSTISQNKITFNGVTYPKISFTLDKPFLIAKNEIGNIVDSWKIVIIYGGIPYSITDLKKYNAEIQNLVQEIRTEIFYKNRYAYLEDVYLCIPAEPNSLSVVPSRENLHIDNKTTTTLKKLLTNCLEYYRKISKNTTLKKQVIDDILDIYYQDYGSYLMHWSDFQSVLQNNLNNKNHGLVNTNYYWAMSQLYSGLYQYTEYVFTFYKQALAKKYQNYCRIFNKKAKQYNYLMEEPHGLLQYIFKHQVRLLKPTLQTKLDVCIGLNKYKSILDTTLRLGFEHLYLLEKQVNLYLTKTDLKNSGLSKGLFCKVSKKQYEDEEYIKKNFIDLGFKVHKVPHQIQRKNTNKPVEAFHGIPLNKAKNYYRALQGRNIYSFTELFTVQDCLNNKYQYVYLFSAENCPLERILNIDLTQISNDYEGQVIIVTNKIFYEKLRDEGLKDFQAELMEKALEKLYSKEVRNYYAFNHKIHFSECVNYFFDTDVGKKLLKERWGIEQIQLSENITAYINYLSKVKHSLVKDYINTIPFHKKVKKFLKDIHTTNLKYIPKYREYSPEYKLYSSEEFKHYFNNHLMKRS